MVFERTLRPEDLGGMTPQVGYVFRLGNVDVGPLEQSYRVGRLTVQHRDRLPERYPIAFRPGGPNASRIAIILGVRDELSPPGIYRIALVLTDGRRMQMTFVHAPPATPEWLTPITVPEAPPQTPGAAVAPPDEVASEIPPGPSGTIYLSTSGGAPEAAGASAPAMAAGLYQVHLLDGAMTKVLGYGVASAPVPASISPDGRLVATASSDGRTLEVRELVGGQRVGLAPMPLAGGIQTLTRGALQWVRGPSSGAAPAGQPEPPRELGLLVREAGRSSAGNPVAAVTRFDQLLGRRQVLQTASGTAAIGQASPDGQWLTYASGGLAYLYLRRAAVAEEYIVDRCGGPPGTRSVAWAPDLSRVAFMEESGRHEGYDWPFGCPHLRPGDTDRTWTLVTATLNGEVRSWLRAFNDTSQPGLAWSPDGRWIAVTAPAGILTEASDERPGAVYLVDAESGETRKIADTVGAYSEQPAWSPDGNWLAYRSGAGGQVHAYAVSVLSGAIVEIPAPEGTSVDEITWLP